MELGLWNMLSANAHVQTDCHPSYRNLADIFPAGHEQVNHKETYVTIDENGNKITTNTIEGVHDALKWRTRNSNLFRGRTTNLEILKDKVAELVWRFNNDREPMKNRFLSAMKVFWFYIFIMSALKTYFLGH